ncbi:GNAT family N-acetyltransferase [Croceicoccus sp. F390]|uniref:GNAT family N-acetyltransferase n=1 Tax=Croceicoccus esteveae TaxID=3075597 RepID=A0ABU2ZHZ2_9SPHN|nr:GNAT family N-acetyltransferase [Croceicoccus sp. F390]MDT0576223.1 GNAT family N-acetyltransferase [Croceicoccus sp. F390]
MHDDMQHAGFHAQTERLILRDWQEADLAPFLEATNTPVVMRWLGGVMEQAGAQAMLDRVQFYQREHGFTFWILQRKEDGGHLAGEILGFCGLKRANMEPGPMGDVEIGWRLREDAWGRGYATEAARATMDLAFARFAAPHVVALTVEGNAESRRLMDRLGMERRQDLDFTAAQDGLWAKHIIIYDITAEAWRAQGSAAPLRAHR